MKLYIIITINSSVAKINSGIYNQIDRQKFIEFSNISKNY